MADLLISFPACSSLPPRLRSRVSPLLPRSHGRPLAALEEKVRELRLPYQLKQGQSRLFHRLSSGLSMEVIFQKGTSVVAGRETTENSCRRPPLVFVHGSFHAAWCWAEHWLPFFAGAGYDCYAISLIGQVAAMCIRCSILFVYFLIVLCLVYETSDVLFLLSFREICKNNSFICTFIELQL